MKCMRMHKLKINPDKTDVKFVSDPISTGSAHDR